MAGQAEDIGVGGCLNIAFCRVAAPAVVTYLNGLITREIRVVFFFGGFFFLGEPFFFLVFFLLSPGASRRRLIGLFSANRTGKADLFISGCFWILHGDWGYVASSEICFDGGGGVSVFVLSEGAGSI